MCHRMKHHKNSDIIFGAITNQLHFLTHTIDNYLNIRKEGLGNTNSLILLTRVHISQDMQQSGKHTQQGECL